MSYRDGPFNDLKVPITWTAAIAVIVAGVIAAALLLSDRRETLQTEAYTTGKKVFDAADRPVSSVTAAPARWTGAFGGFLSDYLFAVSENRKLKKQLAEMRQWQDVAIAQENVNRRPDRAGRARGQRQLADDRSPAAAADAQTRTHRPVPRPRRHPGRHRAASGLGRP